jgi:hypothetical protein
MSAHYLPGGTSLSLRGEIPVEPAHLDIGGLDTGVKWTRLFAPSVECLGGIPDLEGVHASRVDGIGGDRQVDAAIERGRGSPALSHRSRRDRHGFRAPGSATSERVRPPDAAIVVGCPEGILGTGYAGAAGPSRITARTCSIDSASHGNSTTHHVAPAAP